ncbi:MAG: molybdenum cofactor synthesis domain protein, partial [Frankiales bacterium]|nr:molybdenum cofactor synthesis domain protein [Frankiales bacterium]
MSEHGTGGPREPRDTTQLDLRRGSVSAPRVAVREPIAGRGRDTTQLDFDRRPEPRPAAEPVEPTDDGARVRTVERHLDEILGAVPQPDPIELAVLDAQGLLCAEDVVSERALPSFDQAAVEGYAARADDVASASRPSPVHLAVVGESIAGSGTPSSIGPGLAQKVGAGAMMPAGADVVVPAVWTDGGMVQVAVLAAPPAGSYVRRTADDVAPGDAAVQVGTPIGPAQISLLAAVGRDRVLVRPRPRVAVLSAGSELVEVGANPAPGQVVDVNSYALAAAARD